MHVYSSALHRSRTAHNSFFLSILLSWLLVMVYCTSLFAQSTPTWKRFGTLREARHSFAAYSIASGRALIVGGYVNSFGGVYSGTPTANCEFLDADNRTITPAPAMTTSHAEFASVQMPDGTILIISGTSAGGLTPRVDAYSPQTNSWRNLGNILIARRQHTACALNDDEIIIIGGRLANLNTIAAAEIFNIRTGQSRRIADFPYPINFGSAVMARSGRVMVFGGRSGGGDSYRTTKIYGYNPSANTWEDHGDCIDAVVAGETLRSPDGRLFFTGGTTWEVTPPISCVRTISTESATGFSQVASMQDGRQWHAMVNWNRDTMLIAGGYNNPRQQLRNGDWLNTFTGQSTPSPLMSEARVHFKMVSLPQTVNGRTTPRVFAISGLTTNDSPIASVEVLDVDTARIEVPTIASFTPTRGTSGTVVVITGTGFTSVTSVSVGGVAVRSFRIDSPTQITATLGTGASGAVRVSTSRGSASRDGFVFAAPMQVTTVATGLGRGMYYLVRDQLENIYIPAQDIGVIYKVAPSGSVSKFFTVPPRYCTFIGGIVRDKTGYFYVSYGCGKDGLILKISPDGKQSTTFYQVTSPGSIYAIDVDADGNFWAVVEEDTQGRLLKISPSGQAETIYAGKLIGQPRHIQLDGRGGAYVSNYMNHSIVKFSACAAPVVYYQGPLSQYPQGIVIGESGNLYIASNYSSGANAKGHLITKITPSGEASVFAGAGVAGTRDGGLLDAQFNGPTGMLFTNDGNMFVTDYYSGNLRKISNVGELPLNTNVKLYAGPQFNSFSPTSGGSGTVITLRGANLSCVKSVSIGGVPAASFTIVSDTEIRATVGVGASGTVRVSAPTGDADRERFTFLTPPTITSFAPTSVSVGTTITIQGTNFLGATSVKIGGVEATLFAVNSDTRITAIIPAGATNGTVSVQTPAGIAVRSGLTFQQGPSITSFSVSDGAASMGDTVVIRGRNFTGATSVRFGSTTASVNAAMYMVVSDSVIIAIVGRGSSGSVFVTTPVGTASRAGFVFVTAPLITRVAPNPSTAGTVVSIIGSGFTGAHTVAFGASSNPVSAPSFTVVSDSLIRAVLPIFPTTINGSVFVTSSGGTASLAGVTILAPMNPTPPTTTATMTTTGGSMTVTTGTMPPVTMQPTTQAIITLPPPTITAIAPTSCLSPLRPVTITGTGFVNVVEVKCGIVGSSMIPVRSFTVQSSTQMTVILQGDFATTLSSTDFGVSISTTTGTATRGGLQYTTRPPSITAFTPSSAARGERITIVGAGFTCTERIVLGGVEARFTIVSDSILYAIVPSDAASSAASRLVRVQTNTGVAERSGFILGQSTVPIPTITSFAPTAATSGSVVTLTGTNFSGTTTSGSFTTTAVSIGGVLVPFTVVSPTEITVRFPENFIAPSGDIRVTTPGGTVAAQGFVFIPAPQITDFTPSRAAEGAEVRITGRFFTGANMVAFGNTSAQSFRILSDSVILANVGKGASGAVSVRTQGGTARKLGFTYLQPPTITAFTPVSASSGSIIVITGTNFIVREDGYVNFVASAVQFGGIPAQSFTVDSPTRITARLGAGTTGSVSVSTEHGTASRAGFTLLLPPPVQTTSGTNTPPQPTTPEPPRILGFSPASATIGSVVVISGTGFSGAGFTVRTVSFGGVAAQSFTVISPTEIRAVVGAGASGNVSVSTPHGTSTFQGFTFIAPPEPAILGFSPATGAAGDTIWIRGRNLRTTSSVSISGDGGSVNAASFTISGDTLVTAILGQGQAFTFGTFRLVTLGGTARATGFTYFAAPVITSFSPAIAGENDAVVINGSGFTGVTAVSFGGVAARSFTVNSASRITAQVAGGSTGSVSVIGRGGNASRAGFTFAPVPTITRFQPDSARAGDTVTISGRGFIAVSFVRFGGVNAASYRVVSDSVIRAVPATTGASGEISLETPGGIARRAGFTFLAPLPTITTFTPQQASVGDIVSITGTNFTGATAVRFGGRAAASFVVNSPTLITARVANGTSGSVTVVTPGGTAQLAGFTFIPAPPRIRSFNPASVGAGTTITILGSDFSGATSVRFGTSVVTSFSVIADTAITVRVPSLGAASVVVDITVSSPSGTGSASGFRYLPAPVIASFTPQMASSGATVRIMGTGFTSITAVRFGGANAQSFTIDSDTQISALVGANAQSGAISAVSSTGTASLNGFMFIPPASPEMTFTDFSPKTAPSGTVITLRGTNFREVTSVEFGGVPAQSFALLSPTSITAIVSTGASGMVRIITRSLTLSTGGFVFVPAPVIAGFTPQSASSGTTVVITGRNFTGVTAVSFGGTAVTFTVESDTRITARIMIGSTGAVSVTGPGGTATMQGFRFIGTVSSFFSSPENLAKEVSILTSVQNGTEIPPVFTMTLFPNPARTLVHVKGRIPEGASMLTLTVRNVLGTAVLTRTVSVQAGSYQADADMQGLSAGVYLVELRTNTGAAVMQKLSKE